MNLNKHADTPDRELVVSRAFHAPISFVYRCWTDPEQLRQWWGPPGFTIPVCELNVVALGAFRIVIQAPNRVEYPLKGHYVEVEPLRRLVMRVDCSEHPDEWHDMIDPRRSRSAPRPSLEGLWSIGFEEVKPQTNVTIRMTWESPTVRDAMVAMGMAEGWRLSLDRLQGLLATER